MGDWFHHHGIVRFEWLYDGMVSGVDYEEGLRFLKDDELPSLSPKLAICAAPVVFLW